MWTLNSRMTWRSKDKEKGKGEEKNDVVKNLKEVISQNLKKSWRYWRDKKEPDDRRLSDI